MMMKTAKPWEANVFEIHRLESLIKDKDAEILDLKLKLAQLPQDDKEKIIAGLMADKARLTNANEDWQRRYRELEARNGSR